MSQLALVRLLQIKRKEKEKGKQYSKLKEKKKKRNNDLAVLPSHDNRLLNRQYLRNRHDLSFAFGHQRSPLYTAQNEPKTVPRRLILVEI